MTPEEFERIVRSRAARIAVGPSTVRGRGNKGTVAAARAKTYVDNLQVAIEQIERSRAQRGVVFVNLRNIVNHDALWLTRREEDRVIYDAYLSEAAAEEALLQKTEHIRRHVEAELGTRERGLALFAGTKTFPVVFNYVATVVGVIRNNKSSIMILRRLVGWRFSPDTSRDSLF